MKRKVIAAAKKTNKRIKVASDEESEVISSEPPAEFSDAESEPPQKVTKRAKKVVTEDSDEEDEVKPSTKKRRPVKVIEDSDGEPASTPKQPKKTPKDDLSESEMSSLIDDEPPFKVKRSKKEAAPKSKKDAKAPSAKASVAKPKGESDPDQEEIKRLQGWLVKCGIRKVWARDPELSKCDTAKEKIKVLKRMLKDVGMEGKYSVEKAAKIKEKREMAKDLEEIQQGELHWGKSSDVTATGRPSRRAAAAKPAPQPKVIFSDDSEEDQNDDDPSDDDDDVKDESEDDEDDGKDNGSDVDDSE